MIKAKMKIGKMDIEIEANDMKSIFKFSGIYGNLPKACHSCDSEELFLDHRSPSGFDYYALKCAKCGASGNFGQAKEGGQLFWKYDTKLVPYVAGPPKETTPPVQEEEDLPF